MACHPGAAVEAAVFRFLAKAACHTNQFALIIDDDAGRLRGDGARGIVRVVGVVVIFNGHRLPILALQPDIFHN